MEIWEFFFYLTATDAHALNLSNKITREFCEIFQEYYYIAFVQSIDSKNAFTTVTVTAATVDIDQWKSHLKRSDLYTIVCSCLYNAGI